MTKKETYKYKEGQVVALDDIYTIQGLAGGDWWDHADGDTYSLDVVITRDIKITITVE